MSVEDVASIELERAKLELERTRLELERLRSQFDMENISASDTKRHVVNPTILVALIGVIGTLLVGILQWFNSTSLERERLRSTLLTKTIELPNREESIKYLLFLRDTKLVDGIDAPIETYTESPVKFPSTSTEYSLLNPSVDIELRSAPLPSDAGSGRGLRALKRAVEELNAGAREFGINGGPWVAKYFAPSSLKVEASNGLPWTMVFVSWCFTEDDKTPYRYSPSVRAVLSEFKEKGWLLKPGELPKAGDIVFWAQGQNSGLAAIVHHVSGDTLYTIAGNVGNLVQGSTSPLDKAGLLGFGRVPD
jgi:hypothetical protein